MRTEEEVTAEIEDMESLVQLANEEHEYSLQDLLSARMDELKWVLTTSQ